MKIKQLCILFVLLPLVCLVSCQARNELSTEAKTTMVKIFAVNNTSLNGRLYSPLRVGDREIFISRIPLLVNKEVSHSEPILYREGQYGLKLKLTLKGSLRWQQVVAEYNGRQLVMLVGGKYKCQVIVGGRDTSGEFNIGAPLSLEEAEKISRDIERNYAEMKEKS